MSDFWNAKITEKHKTLGGINDTIYTSSLVIGRDRPPQSPLIYAPACWHCVCKIVASDLMKIAIWSTRSSLEERGGFNEMQNGRLRLDARSLFIVQRFIYASAVYRSVDRNTLAINQSCQICHSNWSGRGLSSCIWVRSWTINFVALFSSK